MACLLGLGGHGKVEVITVNMIVATLQKLSLKSVTQPTKSVSYKQP